MCQKTKFGSPHCLCVVFRQFTRKSAFDLDVNRCLLRACMSSFSGIKEGHVPVKIPGHGTGGFSALNNF